MLIEPILFFVLLTATIAVSITLVILVSSYVNMLKKYKLLLKEEQNLELQEHKKEIELLEDARKKAATIISDAHFVQDTTRSKFQEQLKTVSINEVKDFEKASADLLNAYKQELKNLKLNTIKIANNTTKDIENNTLQELKDFKEILQKETYASQKIVEQKIEEEYAKAEKEIKAYKEARITKVEDEIYKILQNVASLVLGRAIDLKDHEQLVIDALNKAKEEKVLG